MKLAIPTLFVITLFCILLYQQRQVDGLNHSAKPTEGGGTSSKRQSLMTTRAAQQKEQQERRQADLDEVMGKNAQAMTPKLKDLLINRLMVVRTPQYQKLFDSLHLDSATQANLLDVIRMREERLYDLHRKQRSEGMKGIKQFGEDYKIEQTLAEMQFRHLVGDEKATEILKVEKNIQMVAEREAVHKADSYIRD